MYRDSVGTGLAITGKDNYLPDMDNEMRTNSLD